MITSNFRNDSNQAPDPNTKELNQAPYFPTLTDVLKKSGRFDYL